MRRVISTVALDVRNAVLWGLSSVKVRELSKRDIVLELPKATLYFNILAILQLSISQVAGNGSYLLQILVLVIFYLIQKFFLKRYSLVVLNFAALELFIYLFYPQEKVVTTCLFGVVYLICSITGFYFVREDWNKKWLR